MKCMGCGALLQFDDEKSEGYIDSAKVTTENICRRCFRLKNYGEYSEVDKENTDFIEILSKINKSDDLVVYVMDIFNLNKHINLISKYINNEVLVVLTKRDVLPKTVKDFKVKEWLSSYNINCIDTVIVSSVNNYNIDVLYNKIKKYKQSKNVYIVGNTNVGNSTLINKMTKNYGHSKDEITTSFFPSTTLGTIKIIVNDELIFIDTPGLLDEGSIFTNADHKLLKKIIPKKEIKPITYQLRKPTAIFIEDIARIDYLGSTENSFTIYMSDMLKVERMNLLTSEKLHELKEYIFTINNREDLVINGLGWIKITKPGEVKIYVDESVDVFKRNSII